MGWSDSMVDPIVDLLQGYPVIIEQAVVWGEMDAYQHVNNAVYFRYFENVRVEYFRRLEWSMDRNVQEVGPILAAVDARFRKPLTYPDTALITGRVTAIGVDRLTMEHRVISRRLGAVTTEGKSLIVTYDYRNQQKVPLSDDLRQRIAALEKAT